MMRRISFGGCKLGISRFDEKGLGKGSFDAKGLACLLLFL